MNVPEDVSVNGIEASIFSLLNKILPHLEYITHDLTYPLPQKSDKCKICKKERGILVGYFWDSEWSQRWGFFFVHWWLWPFYRRWRYNGSAQNTKTRTWRGTTTFAASKLSCFPYLNLRDEKCLWGFSSLNLCEY